MGQLVYCVVKQQWILVIAKVEDEGSAAIDVTLSSFVLTLEELEKKISATNKLC